MSTIPTLTSPRLILRGFTLADAAAVQMLAGDPAVADTTLNIPHPYEDGRAEAWISTHQSTFDNGEGVVWAIVTPDGTLMGGISIRLEPRFNRAEMGYWLGKPFWNQGFGSEAARAVIAHGFGALGLNRVYATHLVRNPASGRVMQKAGMTREGRLRQHVRKGTVYEDLEMYGILRQEWTPSTTG